MHLANCGEKVFRLHRLRSVRPASTTLRSSTRALSQLSHPKYENNYQTYNQIVPLVVAMFGLVPVVAYNSDQSVAHSEKANSTTYYRRSEIEKHNKINDCWVTYQGNVYDVTGFLPNHPGGYEKLLQAAGKDIAPFWNIYRQHFNTARPLELLEAMQIGELHPEDTESEATAQDIAETENKLCDPYESDPAPSSVMKVLCAQPINAEPPLPLLGETFITSVEHFFVRNHHPVPHISPESHHIIFSKHEGNQDDENFKPLKEEALVDILQRHKQQKLISSIQCGGNRRSELSAISPTNGANWGPGAIGTAIWEGPYLRDVLLDVYGNQIHELEVYYNQSHFKHLVFVAVDGMTASIPLSKALSPTGDCILATKMNGQPIPPEHGGPVRVIIPGHVGVRNVKWVSEIKLSPYEAKGAWQRSMAYKGFGPSVRSLEGINTERIASLQEQPVTSATTSAKIKILPLPVEDELKLLVKQTAVVEARGFAYSGGGRGIVRVDISCDDGESWQNAELCEGSDQPFDRAWAWTLWKVTIPVQLQPGQKEVKLVCKATDASYNVQPDSLKGIWNLRGINNNAWHRTTVSVPPEKK
jgi:sulfite oxidase